jgi:hypothetical protein
MVDENGLDSGEAFGVDPICLVDAPICLRNVPSRLGNVPICIGNPPVGICGAAQEGRLILNQHGHCLIQSAIAIRSLSRHSFSKYRLSAPVVTPRYSMII